MKKIKKLKLTHLNKNVLEQRQMNVVKGGNTCSCSCAGSSTNMSNMNANYGIGSGGHSVGGCNKWTTGDGGDTFSQCVTCDEDFYGGF